MVCANPPIPQDQTTAARWRRSLKSRLRRHVIRTLDFASYSHSTAQAESQQASALASPMPNPSGGATPLIMPVACWLSLVLRLLLVILTPCSRVVNGGIVNG